MLLDKAIEGLVFVKRVNDVISVAKGVDVGQVFIEAITVCVTSNIEPVPSPFLTIVWRGEQAFYGFAESVW